MLEVERRQLEPEELAILLGRFRGEDDEVVEQRSALDAEQAGRLSAEQHPVVVDVESLVCNRA
jgi:hypothetical protein